MQKFVPVSAFGNQYGVNPMDYLASNEGESFLNQMMKEDRQPRENYVKTIEENGKPVLVFCASLAFMFFSSVDSEMCKCIFRAMGCDWI